MKKILYTSLCIGVISLTACQISKKSNSQRQTDIEESMESSSGCFALYNDGTVANFKSLKLVTGFLKTPFLLADNSKRIYSGEIAAYQNNDHYAVSQKTFTTRSITPVATECLPGFAIRIVKGKLNIYVRKHYNNHVAVDEYFLQSGDGNIVAYTPSAMNELIRSNPEAYEFFNNKKTKTLHPKKLQITAELFNNGGSLSRNK